MECQLIPKNIKINLNRRFGDVILVVEGIEKEINIFKYISQYLLDCNCFIKRKKGFEQVHKGSNPSNIFIVNTENSNIGSIMDDDFRDKLYHELQTHFDKDIHNFYFYYIWDVDIASNKKQITKVIDRYYSAYYLEDYELPGLLLMSYPSIESFEISFFKNFRSEKFMNAEEAKKYVKNPDNKIKMDCITINNLKKSYQNMHKNLINIGINNYSNDYKKLNKKVLELELKIHDNKKQYSLLSLVTLLFYDLNIIDYE